MANEDAHNVGLIGLRSMGFGMACHLSKSSFEVTGYDINEETRSSFALAGEIVADSPREVVEISHCKVLLVMVAMSEQAFGELFDEDSEAGAVLPRNSTIVLCITAAPEDATRIHHALTDDLGRDDITVLDCPVSGGANRAADGSLSVLCSGAKHIPQQASRVLDALSTHCFHVPDSPGGAFTLKMIHQILVGIHIVAAVETTGLAILAGLNLESLTNGFMSSDAASWLYGERLSHLRDLANPPYSSLAIILKDLGLVIAAARKVRRPLFLSTIAEQMFVAAKAHGLGMHDDCASIQLYLADRRIPTEEYANSSISPETMKNLLKGVHLAAALEALDLVDSLNTGLLQLRADSSRSQ